MTTTDDTRTPLDELALILGQARIDLIEQRGYSPADVAVAMFSVGMAASIEQSGERRTSQELCLLAMRLAEKANETDDMAAEPKH